jgi:cob(I)alamin adenosyltransferase
MIYTKTGDKGETSLANGQRVAKTDARIEAYGTVDELNSWIGLLRVAVSDSQNELEWIQNKLFNLGAALSEAPGEWIVEADVKQLEAWIDAMQAVVPKQRAF